MTYKTLVLYILILCNITTFAAPPPQVKAAPPPKPDLNAIIIGLQKRYNNTKTFQANFNQTYKHPFLTINDNSQGLVFFKAKNMLWRYTVPADRQKEFYIQGNKFTYYLIKDKIAYTHNCFERDTLSASVAFLWGKGDLKKSFNIELLTTAGQNPKLNWLTLIPKEKNAPVKSISLGIDKTIFQVEESIVTDLSSGTNHFIFSAIRTGHTLSDEFFIFKKPADVSEDKETLSKNCPTPNTAPAPKKTKAVVPPKPAKILKK